MLFNIPQFIDKEDKLVGPLTAKQLGWMAGAGTVLLVLFNIFDTSAFFLAAIPVVGIFGALAFYQPNNQPLIVFIFSSLSFTIRPKMYIWRRLPEKISPPKKAKGKIEAIKERRIVNEDKIEEISKLLDQR
jgi:hypothetical protein